MLGLSLVAPVAAVVEKEVRRRRECAACERRFTTYERVDELPTTVVKRDGSRESFDREKLLNGLLRACEKRPVPRRDLVAIVDAVENPDARSLCQRLD